MPAKPPSLIGNWEKITASPCSEKYPDTVEFRERGLYFGKTTVPGRFAVWDVGTYELVSDHQIKLSTANDAVISYDFSRAQDVLTFVDPDRCEFKYRRVK